MSTDKKKRSALSMSDKITIMAVIVDIIIVLIEIALHFI